MRGKDTNHEKGISTLLSFGSKVLFILLFLLSAQNSFANTAEPDLLDAEIENTVSTDSTSLSGVSKSQAVIYISSGISISDLETETQYEVVEVSDAKRSIASHSHRTESKKKVVPETVHPKSKIAQPHPQPDETFTTGSGSDAAFSLHQHHNIAVAQTQNPALKHFIRTGFSYFQIVAPDATQAKTPTALAHFCGKIDSDSYSVRPPPAFL